MDALTFGTTRLLRHMTFSEAKSANRLSINEHVCVFYRKMPIKEFRLDRILTDFDMDMRQFIDLCILLGCDYCGSIRGIGRVKAYDLIREHKTIENVLQHIDQTVHVEFRVCDDDTLLFLEISTAGELGLRTCTQILSRTRSDRAGHDRGFVLRLS